MAPTVKDRMEKNRFMILIDGINSFRKLQPSAVIAIMGPDVRWVGTESGYGRETEWSVVPANNLDQSAIESNSQQGDAFKPWRRYAWR